MHHHVCGRERRDNAVNIEQAGKTHRQDKPRGERPQGRFPGTVAANQINQLQPIPVELTESFDRGLVPFALLELGGGNYDRHIRRNVPAAAKRRALRLQTRKANDVMSVWNVELGQPFNPGLLPKVVDLNEAGLEAEGADSAEKK